MKRKRIEEAKEEKKKGSRKGRKCKKKINEGERRMKKKKYKRLIMFERILPSRQVEKLS